MKKQLLRFSVGSAMAAVMLLTACPAGARKVTLKYWIWDSNQLPAVKTMVSLFNERYPNIEVKPEVIPDYFTKLLTVIAANTAPDVYWMNMPTFSVWSRRNMFMDLQPYINNDKEAAASVKATWKTLVNAYSYKGHLYGMPRDYDTICVIYNEDAMRVAGLTSPMSVDKNWTWDTITSYAKKLTVTQGDRTRQWGFFSTGFDHITWLNFIYSEGGDVFKWNDDGSDEFVMNSPQAAKALQWLADKRWKEKVSPDVKSYASPDPNDLFIPGKVAMLTNGSWSLINYNKAIKNFNWNIAELPYSPDTNKRVSVIHGLADVINPSTKHKKEAFTFVKFLASKEAQSVLGKTGTVIPARNDTENLFFSSKLEPSNRRAFERAADYSKPYPMSRKVIYQYSLETIQPYIDQIWNGKATVAKALQDCSRAMANLIKRYSR